MHFTVPPKFMDQVDGLIENNLSNEHFNVDSLSQSLSISSSQVYRKIKAATGCSTSVYIRNYRLQQAKRILEGSDMRISEVYVLVGFNCLSYFSRSFADFFGYAPSQLRTIH